MKSVLFLVHGMGNSADGPLGSADRMKWSADVQACLLDALKAYPGITAADLVLVPILYDDVFQSHVKNWAALAKSLMGTPLQSLVGWMTAADQPDFLWGSVGDVVLYRAFDEVRQHVLTHVARQLAEAIAEHGRDGVQYSVLAHSLGTAVAHDAIQKLATVGIDNNTVLQPPNFRFENFFALANVSRLVWATDDRFYDETHVRPPGCGLAADNCAVQQYVSFRHVADPVPSIVRFVPKAWDPARFWSVEVRHLRDVNVHAFTHYLKSPHVSDLILSRLFGQQAVPAALLKARFAAFPDYTGAGVAAQAQQILVSDMEQLLNRLSAASHGGFTHDLGDIGDAALSAHKQGLLS